MIETKGIDRALGQLNDFLQTGDAYGAYAQLQELERLAKIGESFEYFMTSPDVEEYVVVSIGKREYDTIEDVISQYEYYKEWQK